MMKHTWLKAPVCPWCYSELCYRLTRQIHLG